MHEIVVQYSFTYLTYSFGSSFNYQVYDVSQCLRCRDEGSQQTWCCTRKENGRKKRDYRGRRVEVVEIELIMLGKTTAESLLHTLYFYNGKLFGLRSNEHRLLRARNFKIVDNLITLTKARRKRFLVSSRIKNITKIKHECHRPQEGHSPCLQFIYESYIELVKETAESIGAFYLKLKGDGSFGYEKSPIELDTLNTILPEDLCARAGLP